MEQWKKIEGYEYYWVSSYGRVWSTYGKGRFLYQDNNKGYLRVSLNNKTKSKKYFIHVLVARAFINNIENKQFVNHIDENKMNNNINNLEWVTAKENNIHGTRLDRIYKPVNQYDLEGNLIKKYKSITEAANEIGGFTTSISKAAKGKYKTSYGYVWKYEED